MNKQKKLNTKSKPVYRRQCPFSKLKKRRKENAAAKKELSKNINDEQTFDDNKKPSPEKCHPEAIEIEKCNCRNAMINIPPLNNEICAKIDDLEKQLYEMAMEFKDIRQKMLDPYNFLKIKFLSQQFREVNELLTELKVNCLKCRNVQISEFLNSRNACFNPRSESCGKYPDTFNQKPAPATKANCNLNHASTANNYTAEGLPKQTTYKPSFQCNQMPPLPLHNTHCNCLENCGTLYQHLEYQNQMYPPYKSYPTNQCYNPSSLDLSNTTSLLSKVPSESCLFVELPIITSGLGLSILQIMGPYKPKNISLTVVLESNHLYHINVSVLYTSQSLGCVYATESAVNEALENNLFDNFVTFFVFNSQNSLEERNKMLNYSLELMNSSD